eukprot:TRINITY_DN1812_c0_g1_i1.p1 TRINITY_DN1812_c0_g1~~TRINITY_DN1812_c0_g1_i1.p1  ORF type:complete len:346 (+),score=68.88 TRINITY_DN1812_c0_g1_i1:1504-2541(+)
MTRGRSSETHVPSAANVLYYEQRSGKSGAGLIITEGTGVSRQGLGWFRAPGIWNAEQVAEWKKVADAVHKRGSSLCVQLWHMGRQAHSDVTGEPVVSACAEALSGDVTTEKGIKKPYQVPVALSDEGIARVVADFGTAAKNAVEAGADFVEIHAANGYLVDQFIQSVSNKRTDGYGGSSENRLRFMREVVAAVVAGVGGDARKVGIRLSPNGKFGEMGSADNLETFDAALEWLNEQKLAFVHIIDGLSFGFHELTEPYTAARTRQHVPDRDVLVIVNAGYDKASGEARLAEGDADIVAIGRPFMANPDLTRRYVEGIELAPVAPYPDWWGWQKSEEGYTTFPAAE